MLFKIYCPDGRQIIQIISYENNMQKYIIYSKINVSHFRI